ncbi:lachesin-like isoform X2 [Planococcus citri]|uniref:lachesin-like isoform X2 n=1 Tax=Planococcus citri TaxID=170843 RepID=UPI0031FA0BBF
MHFSRHVRSEMEAWLYLLLLGIFSASSDFVELPKFEEPIVNVTVPVGREAILACLVNDLSSYKVAWLRVDTQTILTIHTHVITKNHRIGVSQSDHRAWYLHIKEVRESDRGWYMCQINTDPMKSQVGLLDVVVPPDILDYPTSTDMVVREGSNVSLRCAASGSPAPNITWKRENGEIIPLGNGVEVMSAEGSVLNITRVNRMHMGPYLCIASNGVPPSVSKRIMLIVNFPPMIWIQNQLIGAYEGQQLTLECHSEAYPRSINYWAKGEAIAHGTKYEPSMSNNAYKVHMKLTIKSVGPNDYGAYKCISRNSLGETDGTIKVYPIEYKGQISTIKPRIRFNNRKHSARRGSKDFKNSTRSNNTTLIDYDSNEFGDSDEEYNDISDSASLPVKTIPYFLIIFATYYKLTAV